MRGSTTGLFYRLPLIPGQQQIRRCSVSAPPVQPSTPTDIKVENLTLFRDEVMTLQFFLSWEPPMFANGELETYELYIGREHVEKSTQNSIRRNISVSD